jgi:hypothetical protein
MPASYGEFSDLVGATIELNGILAGVGARPQQRANGEHLEAGGQT